MVSYMCAQTMYTLHSFDKQLEKHLSNNDKFKQLSSSSTLFFHAKYLFTSKGNTDLSKEGHWCCASRYSSLQ